MINVALNKYAPLERISTDCVKSKDTTAVAPKLTTSEVKKNPFLFWESHDPTQYSINKAKL